MSKNFSLIFGYGTANEEEIEFEYASEFNPYEGMQRRVAVQKTLAGSNVQDSGFFYGDGKITVSGKVLKREKFEAFWAKYTAAVTSSKPFVFVSYLTNPPEKWQVVWLNFTPKPLNDTPDYFCSWTMQFQIIGKLGLNGELIP